MTSRTKTGHACDVTLSVYAHRASLKDMPGHGGNRTYDLWNTSPMLCQLRYAVRSVRVCDISELSLVLSMLVFQRSQVRFPPWSGISFKLARCGYTLRVTSQASYSPETPEYITPTQNKFMITTPFPGRFQTF